MKSDPTKETILFFGIMLGLVYLLLWGPLVAFQIPAISFVDQQMGPTWPIAMFFIGGFTPSLTALVLIVIYSGPKYFSRKLVGELPFSVSINH